MTRGSNIASLVSGLFLHGLLDANLFKMAAKQHLLSQSGQGLKLRPDWLSEYFLAAILNKLASNKTCNFRPLTQFCHCIIYAWPLVANIFSTYDDIFIFST